MGTTAEPGGEDDAKPVRASCRRWPRDYGRWRPGGTPDSGADDYGW
jgi:hypothetical protein